MVNTTSAVDKNTIVLLQITLVLLGAPIFVLFDSPWFSDHFFQGQDLTNFLMMVFFCWILLQANRKLYWLMLIIVMVSFCAELIGSKLLTVYSYHLNNIPPFIPLGHSVVYAIVYQISRQSVVWKYRFYFENSLQKFALIICSMSLIVLNDCAGFLCYLFFLIILSQRKKPLFYLTMFVVTYYLEFLGTVTSAWSYYFVLGNHPNYPCTSHTPCGIAGIYTLVDIVSNTVYLYVKKLKKSFNKKYPQIRAVEQSAPTLDI